MKQVKKLKNQSLFTILLSLLCFQLQALPLLASYNSDVSVELTSLEFTSGSVESAVLDIYDDSVGDTSVTNTSSGDVSIPTLGSSFTFSTTSTGQVNTIGEIIDAGVLIDGFFDFMNDSNDDVSGTLKFSINMLSEIFTNDASEYAFSETYVYIFNDDSSVPVYFDELTSIDSTTLGTGLQTRSMTEMISLDFTVPAGEILSLIIEIDAVGAALADQIPTTDVPSPPTLSLFILLGLLVYRQYTTKN
ncbi:hypothetical protein HR060_05945 [Catenovulum sp. SM1970]|uniref:hypothetical protein n=1 Tax=Marinifaba aquimaris TaxID=2741323 RepID=UPI0015723E9F|nr:hypothetical protein [Marinifaba aquimaris]NTS76406.1 hypothetical protein [Marinifaba aquimaris]